MDPLDVGRVVLKESARIVGEALRQSGLLVVVVGLSLLSLAAGDALAGAELGGVVMTS